MTNNHNQSFQKSIFSQLLDNNPFWLTIILTIISALIGSFWYVAQQDKEIALLQESYADIDQDHKDLQVAINELNTKIDHQNDKIDQLYGVIIELEKDKQQDK